jgi:tRNA(fMet)-specific endonuclease VapC
MFLLDTDHIGILQWRTEPENSRLRQRMSQHPLTAFYFSIVRFHEQILGANVYVNRARTPQEVIKGYEIFDQVLDDFAKAQVLPFDTPASALFALLRSQKVRIGTMDLRIAAIALSRDMVVLSRNLQDFQKVPGLKVEDWTK